MRIHGTDPSRISLDRGYRLCGLRLWKDLSGIIQCFCTRNGGSNPDHTRTCDIHLANASQAGSYECSTCASGKYKAGPNNCADCTAGTYSEGGMQERNYCITNCCSRECMRQNSRGGGGQVLINARYVLLEKCRLEARHLAPRAGRASMPQV